MTRKIIFWLHLLAGVVAGLVILVMSVTGAALAFEKELIAWAERDVRRVTVPPDAPRLPLDELLERLRAARPDFRPASVTVLADPSVAVFASAHRTNGYYLNPYTGAVQPQGARRTRAFLLTMVEWHRYLGRHDTQRPAGKAVTGAANVAFCFLAVSGLWLWWPRQWSAKAVRAITRPDFALRGQARDWNWHNAVGFWCAPVLFIITLSATPISYRWVTDSIYKMTRTTPPSAPGPLNLPAPAAGAAPLGHAALLAAVQQHAPRWHTINFRPGDRKQGVTFSVKQHGAPRFVNAQYTLDGHTAALLRAETYADYNTGRRVRSWLRFLHTGEALGPVAQFLAGLASLGGAVLVATGLALATRRFLRWRGAKATLSTGRAASGPPSA